MTESSFVGFVFVAWLALGYIAFVLTLWVWEGFEKFGKRKKR